jgi:hypothetical protein
VAEFFRDLGLAFIPIFVAMVPAEMLACDFQYAEQI